MTAMKTCTACAAAKPATTEHFNKKLDGLTPRCRLCLTEQRRNDTAAKARANSLRRDQRIRDPEAVRAKERSRYGESKRAAVAAWRAANPDKVKEIGRRHYQRHREGKIAKAVAYAKTRPDQTKATARRLHERRQANDPGYRLNRSIKAAMNISLKGGKSGRRWTDLIGYDLDALRRHLERQFVKGMTWDNYGDWHVDHIVPLSSHEIDGPESDGFRSAWALTNLRPMWAEENIRKGAKRLLLL